MNDRTEIRRAWAFVEGFDVPTLTPDRREEWGILIGTLTADEFQRAADESRQRPMNQQHLRPSLEAFRGYAQAMKPNAFYREFVKPVYGDRTPENDGLARETLASAREALAAGIAKRNAK